MDELKAVVETYHPGIIAVSKTWFKSKSIVNISGNNDHWRDRNDCRVGGGVCLFIENSIASCEVEKGEIMLKIREIHNKRKFILIII